MTIGIHKRDRCRLCYSLILRDRSTLFSSSICCQKYYHLFKPIQRTKLPRKSLLPYSIKFANRTVCFRDLIVRYLRTEIHSKKSFSNLICYDCSRILLEVEQCAKYLNKTINQLKRKFNKSNRLVTSSLFATFQKKERIHPHEQLPIGNSDDDEDFDDLDDDDDDVEDTKEINPTNPLISKSRHVTSPLSSAGGDSLSNLSRNRSNNRTNNGECSQDEDGDDEEEDDEDEDDEQGLVRKSQSTKPTNLPIAFANPSMSMLEGVDPTEFQLHFAHMMANIAALSGSTPHPNVDTMMHTINNMQRNLLKICPDPRAMAQVTAAAAATGQFQTDLLAIPSPNKQNTTGRKRKSTPEKRVITQNNGDASPASKHESMNNSTEDNNDHPLELTVKDSQRSNQMIPNGSSYYPTTTDVEDNQETMTPNDLLLSLSPSINRRSSSSSKRARLSTTSLYDHTNNLSMVNLPPSTTDLLSPNHHSSTMIDEHQPRQQRKLEPRPCAECGKILFNDKTHLLHCQTHAKNEKQCWICGRNDDDIKKHILNEHGNQKFTNTGFKCQHCEKVFPDFSDLQTHTAEHSKKKPFECPICHKRFGQQGNLSCHLRIHSGVKPFTCTSCGKAFRHSNSLRRHARTVHSATRVLTPTPNSLLLSTTSTSLSNDLKNELLDYASPSTDGIPSPSMSNPAVDSD